MPSFLCLGKKFQLSQADLDRAPKSVLAEAWAPSSRHTTVSLQAWPEADLDAFQV